MRMFVCMTVRLIVTVQIYLALIGTELSLLPENLPRQIFFAIAEHIHFCGRDSTPGSPWIFQGARLCRARSQCLRITWETRLHLPGRTEKHVAADAGKTIEVGYAHI